MIPYYPPIKIDLGFATIHGFAILVVTGVILGAKLTLKRSNERGIPREEMEGAMRWAVGVGFVVSHWVEVIFYHWDKLMEQGPLALLKIWEGLSSYGGFFGAILGMLIYTRLYGKRSWWEYADLMVQGLVLGWVFGRLGCTTAHDHPGELTNFPLAFAYPNGARHNLGFYEFLYTLFVMLPFTLALHRYFPPKRTGGYVAWITLIYAPVRFFLDFLRADDFSGGDVRYFGLTPAQYACIVVFLLAAAFLLKKPVAKIETPASAGKKKAAAT